MSNAQPIPPKAGKTEERNSAQNAPLRESSPEKALESAPIVEVIFGKANARFRESLMKMPRKPRNGESRSAEYLTPAEVEKLIKGAESVGRHGHRDGTLILVAIAMACAFRSLSDFAGTKLIWLRV